MEISCLNTKYHIPDSSTMGKSQGLTWNQTLTKRILFQHVYFRIDSIFPETH